MTPSKHSVIGIISFALSIIFSFIMTMLISIATYLEIKNPGGVEANEDFAAMLGLGMIFAVFMLIVSIIFGLITLFDQNNKKVFGIIGLCISVIFTIIPILLLIIGLLQ
jgi:hypothetical protein